MFFVRKLGNSALFNEQARFFDNTLYFLYEKLALLHNTLLGKQSFSSL